MSKFGLQLSRRLKEQVVCELAGFETFGSHTGAEGPDPPLRLIVTVLAIRGNRVTLGFHAPLSVKIDRSELR